MVHITSYIILNTSIKRTLTPNPPHQPSPFHPPAALPVNCAVPEPDDTPVAILVGESFTVCVPDTTTSVVPPTTVVRPDTEKVEFTGMVCDCDMMITGVPEMTVVEPERRGEGKAEIGSRGTVVAPVTITRGVFETTVVLPERGTAGFTGTVVGPETTTLVCPEMTIMLPARGGDVLPESGTVAPLGTITKGVPEMVVVLPWSWNDGLTGTVVNPRVAAVESDLVRNFKV